MTDEEEADLMRAKVNVLFELIDELMEALKKADPKIAKQLAINSKLNDFYLIRRGAK